ncbi:lipid A biosynthesis acyltransferase [Hydrogenophaga sp. Root209]|uniref:lysophospholipid acyltransferase family protein n=1 Tax=Hydrogenophaga sp. Root209 TaxID=1736490 RepID=UPI0006F219B4|nr:lysophospholipid acyltransferase family protein [Hydrogenophaga sp. Root209]KRB99795.1 lipid A biosynthesis acyltransferase [Hydrogenophaga sp. Root209]
MAPPIQFLFRTLSLLPLPVLHALGWVLGWASFLLSARYRRRLLAHAKQAGFSSTVALASIGEAGKLVAELPRLWLGRPVRVDWDGAELIEAAQAQGSGVLFLTPHLGCFEITAQAYAQRFGARRPMTVLFRPARQPWLRDLVAGARQRPGLLAAPTTLAGVKQLIKALKGGDVVGLLPDQVPPDGQGIWAPFFGRDAYTMTLSARLAHSGGTKILVSWGERLSWGKGYRVHVRPFGPLDTDAAAAARQINQAMEALVRECPAQYLWSYDRYKSPTPLR